MVFTILLSSFIYLLPLEMSCIMFVMCPPLSVRNSFVQHCKRLVIYLFYYKKNHYSNNDEEFKFKFMFF